MPSDAPPRTRYSPPRSFSDPRPKILYASVLFIIDKFIRQRMIGDIKTGWPARDGDEKMTSNNTARRVMTLAWSRHQYVEFVRDQTVATWLGCHRRAFETFGGVPSRI